MDESSGFKDANTHYSVALSFSDGTLRAPLYGLQGGGVYVISYGVANFEGCNIHDNTADSSVDAYIFAVNRTHV